MNDSEQAQWPAVKGEMAERVRSHDWAATPLGPADVWPQSLKTAVDVCLGSAFSTYVWWGPELSQFYNDASLAILRAKHPAAFAAPARESWADVWDAVGPLVERVLGTGEAVIGEDMPVTADRGGPPEEAFFTFCYSALRDEAGAVAGLFITAIETTEHVRAEAALRESEERLRLIVEGALDYAILTLDPEGLITSWSPGAELVYGWKAGDALGLPVDMTFTPEDRAAGAPGWERATARERGAAPDVRWHRRADGGRVFIDGVTRALRDGSGGVRGFLKVGQDVTERRRAEEALRRAHDELEKRVVERTVELQEMTGELLVEVRERAQAEERIRALLRQLVNVQEEERRRVARELHDTLGQQLTALHLSIEMIKSESGGRGRLQEHIGRTEAIFGRLNSDVDFLAWELRPASLDELGLDAALRTFVREWSEHFGLEADYLGVGPHAPRLAPEVETNLYRILQEALQNVHKHAGADRVTVQLERRDGLAVLIVEDNGRGYDAEADGAAGGNTGMGVVNMRERAALVGGELEIESTPGAGTTIFVRVPVSWEGVGDGRG